MSVQSEIARLNTAKSDIATAITNKGVAVPSGTKLNGMAALIDGIESGGGDPELLWTNASPTSVFAAQTVAVESGYNGYIVECKAATSTSNYQKNYVPSDGSTVLMSVLTGDMFIASNNYIRSATGSNGEIVFTNSMRLSAFGANTGYCIPTRIWGVKFTL